MVAAPSRNDLSKRSRLLLRGHGVDCEKHIDEERNEGKPKTIRSADQQSAAVCASPRSEVKIGQPETDQIELPEAVLK